MDLSPLQKEKVLKNSLEEALTWKSSVKCDSCHLPMRRGSEVKSLGGTGIFFTMYSQTTSILYFSWAEIGIIGAPSATVPTLTNFRKNKILGSYKTWSIQLLDKVIRANRGINIPTQMPVSKQKVVYRNMTIFYL